MTDATRADGYYDRSDGDAAHERAAAGPDDGERAGIARVLRGGRLAWAIVGMILVAIAAWWLVSRLTVVVVPLVLALFPAAALAPVVTWLHRRRLPKVLAALLVTLTLLGAIAGLVAAVVPSFNSQLPALVGSVQESITELRPTLTRLPGVPDDVSLETITGGGGGSALQSATRFGGVAVEFVSGLLLLMVAMFFFLYRGDRMADSAIALLPRRRRAGAHELGGTLWTTLGQFFRAQSAVAFVDATLIGVGLAVLGVPLALPLAVLVFLGAFLPIVGAFVTGLLAVLVAFADGGAGAALAVLVLVVIVQQLDGNVIEPLVAGRFMHLPAFAIIVAVAVGATLLGVLGAFLAVPVAACAVRVVQFVRDDRAVPQE